MFHPDRDLNEPLPYKDIVSNRWIERGPGYRVYYASPGNFLFFSIRKAIRQVGPDVVYLNSMFSKYFTLYPLIVKNFFEAAHDLFLPERNVEGLWFSLKKQEESISACVQG